MYNRNETNGELEELMMQEIARRKYESYLFRVKFNILFGACSSALFFFFSYPKLAHLGFFEIVIEVAGCLLVGGLVAIALHCAIDVLSNQKEKSDFQNGCKENKTELFIKSFGIGLIISLAVFLLFLVLGIV